MKRLLPFILAGALSAALAGPVAANDHTVCSVTQTDNRGGAGALAGLIAAAVDDLVVGVNACDINILNNSLNNLLQNADIDVLNNVLNNSLNNLLQNADIRVVSIDHNTIVVDILSGPDVQLITINLS